MEKKKKKKKREGGGWEGKKRKTGKKVPMEGLNPGPSGSEAVSTESLEFSEFSPAWSCLFSRNEI